MSEKNTTDFKQIIRDVDDQKILLPDFQRDFVWKEEKMQRQVVASVLAKMPIGSILLLTSKPGEYSSTIIGLTTEVDPASIGSEEVDFLLDGQQRVTVLANVFSSIIHDKCTNQNDLVSRNALKRRFFLKLPKWENAFNKKESDWFGVSTLTFPIDNPDSDEPDFLSGNICDSIEVLSFNKNDKKPYNPSTKLGTGLDDFCTGYKEGYLIPLFLMIPPQDKARKGATVIRLDTILAKIADGIKDEIMAECALMPLLDDNKRNFIKKVLADPEQAKEILNNPADKIDDELKNALEDKAKVWKSDLSKFLDSCISSMNLHQIRVLATDDHKRGRERAIDIYENLNRGGVSLSTFDLIMAKVATVNKAKLSKRIKDAVEKQKLYPADNVLPDDVKIAFANAGSSYNATLGMKCYKPNKNELTGRYIDIFLDVLGLYSANPSLDPDIFKIDHMKKDAILELDPKVIDQNCGKVIEAIDRAMFFLQTRCGVRSLQEINYSLMVVLISTVFLNDAYYYDKKVHDLLEAWYWGVLFSGEYDKDQNVRMITNLQSAIKTIKKEGDLNWLDGGNGIIPGILATPNFSDKELLLMDKVKDDRIPKRILRDFACQFILSRPYADMFNSQTIISVFSDEAETLQQHHIIPLGSVKKISQMNTSEIRGNSRHICNSPLNFVYITAASNRRISDDSLETYVNDITDEAKQALGISAYTAAGDADGDQKIRSLLEQRYTTLKGLIGNRVNALLINWR